jgi:hypothetical protein
MDKPRLPRPANARAPGRERLPHGQASAGDRAEAAEGATHEPVTGTSAWECGAAAIAESPWTINTHTLSVLASHPELWDPDDPAKLIRVAEHKRLAMDTFYLPTTMDFRGRIYYRTPWVSPQSGDLGKALLCFPPCARG